MNKLILLLGLIVGILFFSCMSPCMSPFRGKEYQMSSFQGKVVDAETKEPIERAAVLVVYHASTMSVAGSNYYAVDAQEALTDVNGEFKIPSKTVPSEKVFGKLPANVIIFKPGYGAFPNHKLSKTIGENKSWPPPEKYVVYEMLELETR